jgi:hypothetical protein
MGRLIEIYQAYNTDSAQQSLSGQGVGGVGGATIVSNTYIPTATPYGAGNVGIFSGDAYTGAGTTYNGQGTGAGLVSPPQNNTGYQGHY